MDKFPLLCEEWDYNRNTIRPTELTSGSKYKAWWCCPNGHSYQTEINKRTGKKPTNCPYCAGKKILKGYNDLATRKPEILVEWNYEKNIISPSEIGIGSHKKVWWKCEKCGQDWEAAPEKRIGRNQGCPHCRKGKKTYEN